MSIARGTAQGQYGSQVWVANKLGFRVQQELAVSPRIMSVTGTMRGDSRRYHFVSAHAPTEEAPQDDKNNFHDSLTSVLAKAKAACPSVIQFLMIDANGRVGSVAAECFGEASADPETQKGTLLRSTLTAAGLIAVNTVRCPGYTWRSAKQSSTARIDYVCAPLDRRVRCTSTYIEGDVDVSLGAQEDHRVLAATFKFLSREKLRVAKPCALAYNKANLRNPSCVWRFQERVWRFWHDDSENIDGHAASLNECIKKAAASAFGKPTDRPVKPWIKQSTWAVIKWIAPLRRASYQSF